MKVENLKTHKLGVVFLVLLLFLIPVAPITSGAHSSDWYYSSDTDSMTGRTIKRAWVVSTNTVRFDFPYGGAQHAVLSLRRHPRYGHDAILSVERGQFLCSSYDGCSVLVRFDGGKATRWGAVGPEDQSTTSLFVEGSQALVTRLRKAKTVRIAAKFFQQGEPVFIFNVRGLVW